MKLTQETKKAMVKRTADALEKMAAGSVLAALFRDAGIGLLFAIICMFASYIFTAWEVEQK